MSTLTGVIAAATRHADSHNDLALAAGEVIARRVALGVNAAFDPMGADHAEFGRMVPEKMEAFSAASAIMLDETHKAGWAITRLASHEVMTAAKAVVSMTLCTTPASLAGEQSRFAMDWMNRAAANFYQMGMIALGAQQAALVPIRRTVAANSKRLGVRRAG